MTALPGAAVYRPTRHAGTRWAVRRATEWAEQRDVRRGVAFDPETVGSVPPIGHLARSWAAVKFGVLCATSPVTAPALLLRAAANQVFIRRLIRDFPHQYADLVAHRHPLPPANRTRRLPSPLRAFISSDLHRCVPGRNDWPARQHTKSLYAAVLDFYADHDAHLVENGDVEDFWMMGGSAYGAVYDMVRLGQRLLPRGSAEVARLQLYGGHLDRIIANNTVIYRRITDRFVAHGRYHRTVGNHDDVYLGRSVAALLTDRLGVVPCDWLVFDGPDGRTEAVINHGHHTDAWCAPHRARLGKLSSWVAGTLSDVPLLNTPDGLEERHQVDRLLNGQVGNHLLRVNPVFGASRSYDSLDEEALFDAMGDAAEHGPWLLFGHTHVPVDRPWSRSGRRWWRYANSGSGVARGMVTGLEWDTTSGDPEVRLVAWARADDRTPAEAVVTTDGHSGVARYVIEPTDDGHLSATVQPYAG